MIEFLLFVLFVALAVRWFVIRARLSDIEQRLEELSAVLRRADRVRAATPEPWPLPPAPAPVRPPSAPAPPPLRVVPPPAAPILPIAEALPPPAPPPGPGERLRRLLGDDEWETLVGGSLLNKLGALVLVVGIALFLAYSLTLMTPAARTLTAFLLSGALLASGVWLERQRAYRVFSRGLIGAGWAGLYCAAYAMYALPAARVIDNAFLGSLLLLAVAAGMIGHSLRYRAQALAAIAYFAAFAALAVTPEAPFAVVALIPLAASLLYLAWRLGWHAMAAFGLAATYATCVARGSSDAPLASTQTLFLAYWLLFEAFDLLRIHRRDRSRAAAVIFPLNAIGFLGLSYLAWSTRAPAELWLMAAMAAALYLAGALARAWLRPPSSFAEDLPPITRYEEGGYEAPLTLAGFLAGLAIAGKVPGVWMGIGLAIEAQILYLAGVRLNARFLRVLGGLGFGFSMARLLMVDAPADGRSLWLGQTIRNWTPPVLFHAALFYLNRFLNRPAVAFSWMASALIALAVAVEVPAHAAGAVWILLAAALLEFGVWKALSEFRYQAYGLMSMGAGLLIYGGLALDWRRPWIPAAAGLACAYFYSLRASRFPSGRVALREIEGLTWGAACATLLLGLALLRQVAPAEYVGIAWWLFALLLFEAGLRRLPEQLRKASYGAAGIATLAVLPQYGSFAKFGPPSMWAPCFGAGIAAWIMAARAASAPASDFEAGECLLLRRAATAVGTLLTLAGIWAVAPSQVVPVAWAAMALLLLVLGRRLAWSDLLWESRCAAALAFLHVWIANFPVLEITVGISSRLLTAVSVAGILYLAEFQAARQPRARSFFSLLATLLVSGLLWYEVSGGLLTVAWGVQGLLLLGAGFPAHERPLRFSGLALLLFCISKLFIYDLRHLETLYRILSFVALGLILLGVSWIYTRFRDTVRRGLLQG